VRFVDGFCTAAVAATAAGSGTEAFFPDARGQVLVWGTVLRAADGVWIDADAGPRAGDAADAPSLTAHLERYHIRERLDIAAAGEEWCWLLVAGPEAAARLARGGLRLGPGTAIAHDVERIAALAAGEFPTRLAGVPVAAARSDWAGPGSFLVVARGADRGRLVAWFDAEGIAPAAPAAVDAARREEGRPAPADIPPRTLPQELGRDRRAISFTKGCYLGQETVARLDSLGHVNRRLAGIALAEGEAAPGTAVEWGGEIVGTITSGGTSPRHGGWLGLALVRVAAARPGTPVGVAGREARVVELGQTEPVP
jgi:folate-binding protein YgfZ